LNKSIIGNKSNYKKINSIILIIKISIIIFSAYSITANFLPFYEGANPFFYAVNSVLFAEGKYEITNELLRETERPEFIPENWLMTKQGNAVPMSGTGLMVLGTLFYFIGGYYGLFYLSPIIFIILLVASERTASKLFGNYVGLFTLLIVASSNLLFRNSIALQTESIFSLLLIIGVFYLIKFLKTKNNYYLLISTVIFTLSTWVRLNGLIALPLEILIISSYFIISLLFEKKSFRNKEKIKQKIKKIKTKNIVKISSIIIIPWLFFLISNTVYYEYNFGNPLTNYGEVKSLDNYDPSMSAIFKFDEKNFENVKQYSKYLLPYQFPAIYNNLTENFDNILGKNWIGLISISSLLIITGISFYTKDKRTEIFILIIFVLSIVWFFSSITSEYRAEQGVAGRYMLPIFILSSMIFGYMLQKIIRKEIFDNKPVIKNTIHILKIILIIMIGIFFIIAFYFSNPIQIIEEEGWKFNNPEILMERYPLNLEGLTKKDVIITNVGVRAVEYEITSFNPKLSKDISLDSVKFLKESIMDKYNVYIFKIPFNLHEKNMINNLVNEHGFILKEHSKTFCKIELSTFKDVISDKICINNEPIRIPKS